MKARNAYEYDADQASLEGGLQCLDPSLAEQSMAEETDINLLIKRFGIGYEMPSDLRLPQYGDFTGINDFHTAVNRIAVANENFELLHADIRDRFQNDPGKFVDFAVDPKNKDEMIKMGLLKAREAPRDHMGDDGVVRPVVPPSDNPTAPPAPPGKP